MYRILLSVLALSAVSLASPSAFADPKVLSGPIPAFVEQVIDGDTIRVRARVWLNQEVKVLVRVSGVDAPELRSRCEAERKLAYRVKRIVQNAIAGKKVMLSNIRRGKYAGRVIADVTTKSGIDLASNLLESGQVRKYQRGRRKSWCDGPIIQGQLPGSKAG